MIMKKTYKVENLDCANCAAKIEAGIAKISGVESASLNFMTQRLTIEAAEENYDDIIKQAQKICKKTEPDCKICF